MNRYVGRLLQVLLVGLVVVSVGRAYDHETVGRGDGRSALPKDARTLAEVGNAPTPPSQSLSGRYQGKTAYWWAKRAVQARKDANARQQTIDRLRGELSTRNIGPTLAIRAVFGPYANAALAVAWCESRWWAGASNGQYLGLFQMGDYARSRYGHSSDPLGQARAAYAYFAASGYDWSPWTCKP